MRWTAAPDRREVALVLILLAIHFFAYNLDTFPNPTATQATLLGTIGLGRTKAIGADGRKPPGWRDRLENEIFGDWKWDEGHVMGHLREKSQPKVSGRHGASWLWKNSPVKSGEGRVTVHNALERWRNDIRQTKVVKHAPGYTIIDNVYIVNGTVYLISDTHDAFPPLRTMVMTSGNGFSEWKLLSVEEGRKVVGKYGSTIRGVSWMTADSNPHNSTLFALWRAYSSMDPLIDSEGKTTLSLPHRLIFPHNRFFTDANPGINEYLTRRRRVDTGFHPYTAKAAFPHLTVQYFEDWEDYEKMGVPFVFERLVVTDRQPAQSAVEVGQPPFASALRLQASPHWWEPIRRNMAQFLGLYDVSPMAKRVVTYLHSQSEPNGLKLSNDDHEALVTALRKMGKKHGYQIQIVSSQTADTDWTTRMSAIVKSSVVLSVHGSHMIDTIFMRRTPQSMVMELFPEDKYARDQALVTQSIGIKYMAWWGSRSATSDFPPFLPPGNEPVSLDPPAVVQAIVKILSS